MSALAAVLVTVIRELAAAGVHAHFTPDGLAITLGTTTTPGGTR